MKNFNIPIEIDTDDIKKQINIKIEERAKQEANYRLNLLFINPKRDQEYDALRRMNNNDPDISVAYLFIKETIDKKILSDDFQEHINKYIDENFTRHLNDALDKAIIHKAHSIAFKSIKENIEI